MADAFVGQPQSSRTHLEKGSFITQTLKFISLTSGAGVKARMTGAASRRQHLPRGKQRVQSASMFLCFVVHKGKTPGEDPFPIWPCPDQEDLGVIP